MVPVLGQTEKNKPPDLYIFYTTDTHGHLLADEETIGIDRIAAVRKALPHSLLLGAGDLLHSMPLAVLNQGQDVIQFMKSAGHFSATAGNHGFDYGQLQSLRFAETNEQATLLIGAGKHGKT